MSDPSTTAEYPDFDELLPVTWITAPHPATLPAVELTQQCDLRTQRRSGPGGQHRNKVSSGVFLTHRESGLVGEATERRSQTQNRDVALTRLRFRLAVERRTKPGGATDMENEYQRIRSEYGRRSLKIAESNPDKPAVLTILLDDLHLAGGQPSLVAPDWSTSTSAIVALLKSHPPALEWINKVRAHHKRLPLR
ncbi:MAG: peptide chain release factor-like protein [Planctomycetota bacterium]